MKALPKTDMIHSSIILRICFVYQDVWTAIECIRHSELKKMCEIIGLTQNSSPIILTAFEETRRSERELRTNTIKQSNTIRLDILSRCTVQCQLKDTLLQIIEIVFYWLGRNIKIKIR